METLICDARDDVLLVRLNRPARRNALNLRLLEELDEVLAQAEAGESVRALVVTGDAKAFSAGQDLKEEEPPTFLDVINAVLRRLEMLPKPTVAAIDGWCIAGGLELALCCDVRVCATTAKIGDWHARINSIGGAGATVRLVRLIGLARAKELVFSGAVLDAESARAAGLVSRIFAPAELVDGAVAVARSLCVGAPHTVRHAKQALHAAADLALDEALAFARECQRAVRDAQDGSYVARFGARRADESRS